MRDATIRKALLAWFDAVARDLPWRRDRAPYAVWLSEVMLQQTRVETVVPYFERFVRRYPDVGALAAAELDDVLELWSGLGYYRRARVLHATAREVVARYGGAFPETAAELRELPGIGAYTAGAISSLAFGRREALVDGNVARVLARLEGIDAPIKQPATVRRLWATAERLVPASRPGAFNEALMELGATVCTPREPRCEACPIAGSCVARAEGRAALLPVVAPKKKVPTVPAVAVVVRQVATGRVLFARRRDDGLFGGLWEPPLVEVGSISEARPALRALGIDTGSGKLADGGQVTHVLSHRRMEVTVALTQQKGTPADNPRESLGSPYEKAAWLDPLRPGVGVSTLARKVLAAARLPQNH